MDLILATFGIAFAAYAVAGIVVALWVQVRGLGRLDAAAAEGSVVDNATHQS